MSNLKGKVSLLLALVIMMMTILPIATVNAAEEIMTLTASYNGSTLKNGQSISADKNSKVTVNVDNFIANYRQKDGGPDLSTLVIYYAWDGVGPYKASTGSKTATVTVPSTYEAGSKHTLQLEAVINDKTYGFIGNSNIMTVYVNMAESGVATTVSATLKAGNTTVSNGGNAKVAVGTKLVVSVATNDKNGVAAIAYRWDNDTLNETKTNPLTITVPSTFKAGETHTLRVQARAADGTKSPAYTYTFTIPTESSKVVDGDDLVVEAWMKESKDLDSLAVSLRNDSDENEKSNKNIYALNEKVTYYVDYKNADSKTKKNLKIVLQLPLDVEVVDAFGGTVSGKTITWEIPELEEDEAGTKVVVVKYTSLGKASVKSKIVYPVVDLYEGKKVVDSSSVINLIFKDEDTEIVNDEHYPYMYGDKESDTFRPDDGITRAEGALVLTRIFGMNTSGVKITNVYPDLDETYVEAQKAIVAATNAGLINGYTDGTYRPNEKMTRAEFMKILAANIELAAEDEDLADNIVDGLSIKYSDEEIKIYKNPTKSYVVNGNSVSEHWASPYVTLLARLNMTGLTDKSKDLRLDEEITRAEVAQLVNFYLFRAPAEVTSKTKSGFSDVSKKHKLFADIVEATRDAHTYTLTEKGTEVGIDD